MQIRSLGNTGYNIAAIGFGGIPIQRLDEEEAISLIHLAKQEGINFIDTARGYENSESLIGKGIEGVRAHWIIATKSMARDYEGMKKDIEISLKNLGCGYIDLYQCHNVRTKDQYDAVMSPTGAYKALDEAMKEGKIKAIGITSHDLKILDHAVETDYFSTIQFPYNAVERQAEHLFKKAKQRNIGVIVMKPLAGGAITKGNLALRFILENPNVSVVIPGIDKAEQVSENASVAKSFIPLNEDERVELENLAKELGSKFCRRCGYCLPCPQEIDIPTQFLMEGYYTRYDLKEWAATRYTSLPKRASDCIECGKCETRCPYDLPIREMLKNVTKQLG